MRIPAKPIKGERIEAETIADIIDCIRALVPRGCGRLRVQTTPGGTTISCGEQPGGGGGEMSGEATRWDGVRTTELNSDSSKGWVKYDRDTGLFSEETGPPPEPWGRTVWWRKAGVVGDIVCTVR